MSEASPWREVLAYLSACCTSEFAGDERALGVARRDFHVVHRGDADSTHLDRVRGELQGVTGDSGGSHGLTNHVGGAGGHLRL